MVETMTVTNQPLSLFMKFLDILSCHVKVKFLLSFDLLYGTEGFSPKTFSDITVSMLINC